MVRYFGCPKTFKDFSLTIQATLFSKSYKYSTKSGVVRATKNKQTTTTSDKQPHFLQDLLIPDNFITRILSLLQRAFFLKPI